MVCHKAFEYLDADRLIHLGPAAGKLAKPHTDPAAGGGHGVFFKNHSQRMGKLAVLNIVNVPGHIHL